MIKPSIITFSALLFAFLVIAIAFFKSDSGLIESEDFGGEVSGNESFATLPELIFPDDQPVGVEAQSDEEFEALRWRLLGQLAEEFRQSIDEDFRRMMQESSLDASNRRTEEANRYRDDPNWPKRSAVPGYSGFEVQVCPRQFCISDWLADEPDNPVWSRSMESRIMSEIARMEQGGLAHLFAVCRQDSCGIVLPASDADEDLSTLLGKAMELRSALAFGHVSIAYRSNFQAIYLTRRDQSPERMVQ